MMKLTLALPAVVAAAPILNYTTCPSLHEVQTDRVAKEWDMDDYQGYYYELAFHDILQACCSDSSLEFFVGGPFNFAVQICKTVERQKHTFS